MREEQSQWPIEQPQHQEGERYGEQGEEAQLKEQLHEEGAKAQPQ